MREPYFVWLEVTGKCQLTCSHCYAASGPGGSDGSMTAQDWVRVIDQAADLGTTMVQFIGGEPTLYRPLPRLIEHALGRELTVEVYSNLVHVPTDLWDLFQQPRVRLATSYYTDDADAHEVITKGRGSHRRTRDNIVEAVRRSIPLRVGVIDLAQGQRVGAAEDELRELGVTDIARDHLRQVGRGAGSRPPGPAQLCGHCGQGKLAVAPDGSVWPCVFTRRMPVGNVREASLSDIVSGTRVREVERELTALRPVEGRCNPGCCPSTMCDPSCSPSCSPSCRPSGTCTPAGNCAPNY